MFVYPSAIVDVFKKALGIAGAHVDQHQQNGLHAVHQLRVRLPGDDTIYRVIVAPANAPICIGEVDADLHFIEPLTGTPEPTTQGDAA